jgi:hypothetical protein
VPFWEEGKTIHNGEFPLPSLELLTCKSAIIFRSTIISCQQNPPVASKFSSHFYGRACHLQTAGFHYGRTRALLTPAYRHCYIFYGDMWEAFGPEGAAPSWLKTTCWMASRWRLSLLPFVRGELGWDATWWILLEALSHDLRQRRLPGWVPGWLVNETIIGGTSGLPRVFLLSCSLFLCRYLRPLVAWGKERER